MRSCGIRKRYRFIGMALVLSTFSGCGFVTDCILNAATNGGWSSFCDTFGGQRGSSDERLRADLDSWLPEPAEKPGPSDSWSKERCSSLLQKMQESALTCSMKSPVYTDENSFDGPTMFPGSCLTDEQKELVVRRIEKVLFRCNTYGISRDEFERLFR